MGIILGYLCVICFCILSAKFLTAKLHYKKADNLLMKCHKTVSGLLVLLLFLHIILVFPVLKNRDISVIISGIVSILIMFLLIFLCHIIKVRDNRIFWHRVLTILSGIFIVGHMVTYFMDFNEYQKKIEMITFGDIDLNSVKDGIYEGEYDAGYIYAKVEVKIKDGKIVEINILEHRNERGEKAESIINDVVDMQKIDVDVISGATNSSKVIKKAIEKAVENGQ